MFAPLQHLAATKPQFVTRNTVNTLESMVLDPAIENGCMYIVKAVELDHVSRALTSKIATVFALFCDLTNFSTF